MIIYFVRHGETEWNKKGIIQGHKDSPLTLKGIELAEIKGRALKGEDIEVIYSSDLGRCVQTAEIINKYLEVDLIKSPELREINFGDFNGETAERIKKEFDLSDLDAKTPKGESFNQVKKRVNKFISSLGNSKFKKVLLVTHDCSSRTILSEYYNDSKKCITQDDRVYIIELEKGKFKKDTLRCILPV